MIPLSEYVEQFKVMLVRRYNWTVTKAAKYKNTALNTFHKKGLSVEEAYFAIFNIEQDIVSNIL